MVHNPKNYVLEPVHRHVHTISSEKFRATTNQYWRRYMCVHLIMHCRYCKLCTAGTVPGIPCTVAMCVPRPTCTNPKHSIVIIPKQFKSASRAVDHFMVAEVYLFTFFLFLSAILFSFSTLTSVGTFNCRFICPGRKSSTPAVSV